MENQNEEIIGRSLELFMQLGIKSVTMDDVARHLGISKKTLYKYVDDKNDLVSQSLNYNCDIESQEIEKLCSDTKNAIDESFDISQYVFRHIKEIHPSIIFDLQKYHPEAWKDFTNKKKGHIIDCYLKNIEKGIEEGLYREDVNGEIITKIYTSRMEAIFDPEIFAPEKYERADIYLEIFRYHIRGIASEKGMKYLAEKVKHPNV